MGLDVHDMENLGEVWVGYQGLPKSTQFGLKSLRLARPLEPGFVIMVEPGIDSIPELISRWKAEQRFADFICYDRLETFADFGGARIEENLLVTPDGHRILGKQRPRTIAEVEAIRGRDELRTRPRFAHGFVTSRRAYKSVVFAGLRT